MTNGFKNLKAVTDFVDSRVLELDDDVRAVGWGSQESQELRFDYLIKDFNLNSKTILDVGCGLGDFLHYLKKSDIKDYQYIGLDISKNMIESCRERHLQDNVQFYQGTIFEYDFETIDVAILSGALSYKYKEATSAAKATLEKMFQLSTEGVALNFLSTTADYELEKNQHYDPAIILTWALNLSKKVSLYHDYPLYEFTIMLKK
tara:strand:- start:35 stop:646 length:612 start_codon:yes stop_codon:yes gene_type:complete